MRAPDFFSAGDRQRIADSVSAAESLTSSEIRVFIDDKCKGDPVEKAAWVFQKLGMEKTRDRNAVLLYLAMEDHCFAVFGDTGVYERLGQTYWDDLGLKMQAEFRAGRFTDGIIAGLSELGMRLRDHFPKKQDDTNELPDAPAF
ncbi:MAG: TPM domain-containing protein [Bacteroidota bacterium]